MSLDFAEVVESVGGKVTVDDVYSEEARFVMRTFNVLACMGGPNYNRGTESIINKICDKGVEGSIRLLRLIAQVDHGIVHRGGYCGYEYFWDLFKRCQEDVALFLEALHRRVIEFEEQGIDTLEPVPMRFR